MAVRPSFVRFASSRKPARISLRNPLRISCGLCAAALMFAATTQPGFAATADPVSAKASSSAIASAPIAAPGAGATLADARAEATPAQAQSSAQTASQPANAQRAKRPRSVKTASAAPRLSRLPARLRPARRVPPAAIATSYRADCFWFSCGPRVSWLFLGIGF